MKYAICYDTTGKGRFPLNFKGNSCFMTRGEAQRKVRNALSTIPMCKIYILREAKTIRTNEYYWVLAPKGEELPKGQRMLEIVESNRPGNLVFKGKDLLRDKDFLKGKFVMRQIYSIRIKVTIKER